MTMTNVLGLLGEQMVNVLRVVEKVWKGILDIDIRNGNHGIAIHHVIRKNTRSELVMLINVEVLYTLETLYYEIGKCKKAENWIG